MNKFTKSTLAKYDGLDGRQAFVAYEGRVYDVSDSFFWENGQHWTVHSAGRDLTEELKRAPHSAEKLQEFPVIGIFVDED